MEGETTVNTANTETPANTEPIVRYYASPVEHTLVIDRSSEEQVNMAIDHFGAHHTLTIAVFDTLDKEQPELASQVILSYAEARLLKDLLNRPEVSAIIDPES